jgi:hypothetical protein
MTMTSSFMSRMLLMPDSPLGPENQSAALGAMP